MPTMPRSLIAFAAVTALAPASAAQAASPDLVISQVYGGGGNSGAPLRNDFIEVFNRGTDPVDVGGWSVQYAAATGTTWTATTLSGVVAPGRYLLVREAAGANPATELPAADAIGNIAMSATAGKVRVVTGSSDVRDLVGYGATASPFEGSGPAATLTNTTAALRDDDGCTETTTAPTSHPLRPPRATPRPPRPTA